jgi:HPt (histidine-containing phosphotransfer) domain-containing protein
VPSPLRPSSSLPAGCIDPGALARLLETLGGDADFLASLAGGFLRDAPRLVADMMNATSRADAAALQLAAHTLKSNCSDFGAGTLGALCRALEEQAKRHDLAGAGDRVVAAETELARVIPALQLAVDDLCTPSRSE